MTSYNPRHIKFKEQFKVEKWTIKAYTISKQCEFEFTDLYDNVKQRLPEWLALKNGFNSEHDHIAFLIIHAATEGVFSIINWWVGENMLNTIIFKSNYDKLDEFEFISGKGLGPCVWELEVINHERLAWINHVLKNAPQPDFKSYLESTLDVIL